MKYPYHLFQIEKYARHALSEGIESAADLKISRESELFKALNNHYNKTNEFEVTIRAMSDSVTSQLLNQLKSAFIRHLFQVF